MISLQELKELAQRYSVIYVDDEEKLRESMKLYLGKFFLQVDTAVNGKDGLEKYQRNRYDIVITDILMPHMDGLEMSTVIREINEDQEIIVISAYSDSKDFMAAIRIGVSGYVIKPMEFTFFNEVLYKVLYKLDKFRENEMFQSDLKKLVEIKTKQQHKLEHEMIDNYEKTLTSLVKMIEERDPYTGGHSERVAHYAKLIAEKMGHSEEECTLVHRAGILHDIGKIATPDVVLLKPGRLSESEYHLIQEHVRVGADMLKKIPMYQELYEIVVSHHERYDGSGYPRGIRGSEIHPLGAIMIVVDSFDAMTTNRIYKGRKTIPSAIEELEALSGIHFDPKVVEAASEVLTNVDIHTNITQTPNTQIEKERFAYFYKDQVASVYNVNYLDLVLLKNRDEMNYACMNVILLQNFTQYNERYGWHNGDLFLKEFAAVLKKTFSDATLFRIHGDDFVLLHKECRELEVDQIRAHNLLKENNILVRCAHFDIDRDMMHSVADLEKQIIA